jgi:hypothetical protein
MSSKNLEKINSNLSKLYENDNSIFLNNKNYSLKNKYNNKEIIIFDGFEINNLQDIVIKLNCLNILVNIEKDIYDLFSKSKNEYNIGIIIINRINNGLFEEKFINKINDVISNNRNYLFKIIDEEKVAIYSIIEKLINDNMTIYFKIFEKYKKIEEKINQLNNKILELESELNDKLMNENKRKKNEYVIKIFKEKLESEEKNLPDYNKIDYLSNFLLKNIEIFQKITIKINTLSLYFDNLKNEKPTESKIIKNLGSIKYNTNTNTNNSPRAYRNILFSSQEKSRIIETINIFDIFDKKLLKEFINKSKEINISNINKGFYNILPNQSNYRNIKIIVKYKDSGLYIELINKLSNTVLIHMSFHSNLDNYNTSTIHIKHNYSNDKKIRCKLKKSSNNIKIIYSNENRKANQIKTEEIFAIDICIHVLNKLYKEYLKFKNEKEKIENHKFSLNNKNFPIL